MDSNTNSAAIPMLEEVCDVGLLRLAGLGKLDIGPAQVAIDTAAGIDQNPDGLAAIVLAAVGVAVARDHGLGQVAGLQIALAGAFRNQGKHSFRERFNRYGSDTHLPENQALSYRRVSTNSRWPSTSAFVRRPLAVENMHRSEERRVGKE